LEFYIDQIENVDVTAAITSHFDYQKSYVQHIIFTHVNINNSERCPPILIVKPPGIAVLREQQIKEQKLKKQNKSNNNNTSNNDNNSSSSNNEDIKKHKLKEMEMKEMHSPPHPSTATPNDEDYSISDIPLSKLKF